MHHFRLYLAPNNCTFYFGNDRSQIILFEFMFPETHHKPSVLSECGIGFYIPAYVSVNFLKPECTTGTWFSEAAVTLMPETTVNKNSHLLPPVYKIRLSKNTLWLIGKAKPS